LKLLHAPLACRGPIHLFLAKLLARAVCWRPPGALAIAAGTYGYGREKRKRILHSSARTQALQGPHIIHTTPAPQELLPVTRYSDTSDPPRRTPSSFLTSLPGAQQLCQTYMFQAAVVQLPHFPRAEALPPHKMDRVSIVPRSTDSKTQELLTHPIRVAFSQQRMNMPVIRYLKLMFFPWVKSARDKDRFLPTPVDRRMTARDQK
jgi:hypothetical protein